MKTANLVHDGYIIVQIEYTVNSSEGKNFGIDGKAYLPYAWRNGAVAEREFLVSFSSNWECETVLRFLGEDYGTEEYGKDGNSLAYYQTGSVRDLINMSRAMFLIHRLLEMELTETNTYMYAEDNQYARDFNILKDCTIDIWEEQSLD